MQRTDNLHDFLWNSSAINNCNTYLIDGPTRMLIDPGHLNFSEHYKKSSKSLGMEFLAVFVVGEALRDIKKSLS